MPDAAKYVRRFEEITGADVPLVGGKNASLGEMYRELRPRGILVPNGFAITADAYRYVLDSAARLGPPPRGAGGPGPGRCRRSRPARPARPGDRLSGGCARGSPGRDPRRPSPAGGGVRPRADRRGAQLGHRRGSAERQLRRPARELPQRRRWRGPPRRLPAMLRQPLHGSRDPLPHRPGLRPLQGLPRRRGHEDGALRPGRQRGHLLARHGVRIPRRRPRHRRLRPGRERRAGRGGSRTSSTSTNRRSARATGPSCAGSGDRSSSP